MSKLSNYNCRWSVLWISICPESYKYSRDKMCPPGPNNCFWALFGCHKLVHLIASMSTYVWSPPIKPHVISPTTVETLGTKTDCLVPCNLHIRYIINFSLQNWTMNNGESVIYIGWYLYYAYWPIYWLSLGWV